MNQYWFIAFVIWSAAMLGGGWEARSWKDNATAEHLQVDQQKVTIAAESGVITKERTDQQKTNEVSNAYETRVSTIDSLYAAAFNGLRQPGDSTSNGMSHIPDAQPGHNAATCPNGFSRQRKEAVLNLAKQADIQTARLLACQAWIKEHQAE